MVPPLLILDEPTNHLDLDSIEAVEVGLLAYDGALIVTSHDAAFLDAIGIDRIVRCSFVAALSSPRLQPRECVAKLPCYAHPPEQRVEPQRSATSRRGPAHNNLRAPTISGGRAGRSAAH